jgi:UDP-N-acetylmuramate--alanine ligase
MDLSDPFLPVRFRTLVLEALDRAGLAAMPPRVLVVDIPFQRAAWIVGGGLEALYAVSTAKAGVGGRDGSYMTPPGWHRIRQRIGEGAAAGTVFRDRVDTGERWQGASLDEDLILARVLTLDGLEPGVNQGPGVDSLARTIYIHGTNRVEDLGRPLSHGCLRLSSADVVDLFGRVEAGDLVLFSEGGADAGRLHFAGVAGSGMSALAQFVAMIGGRASGSDRSFDRGERAGERRRLEALGVSIVPQDGSGLAGDCAGVVHSTAVEEEVPDLREARRLGVPRIHRSELLARLVAARRTVAVTGTSGKSTTVAMIFEILRGAGRDPSLVTGGDLRVLQSEGLWGNAFAGRGDCLVVEADESDGSVVRYHPAVAVILNLQRDHKEMDEVEAMFRVLRAQTREALVVGEGLAGFAREATVPARVCGLGPEAGTRAEDLEAGPEGSAFRVDGTAFRLPVPGVHNVENALAAIAACQALGLPLAAMVEPLAHFQGVARRFQILGQARGVTVVDDFGHNPAKVAASLATARLRAGRILAVYQPHGYGPTRFLWHDFVEAFGQGLAPGDILWMLEVFYAGGTATRDFSSADLARDIAARGADARFAPSREALVGAIAREARPGDLVLVMGARDPSLTALAREVLRGLEGALP